MGLAIALQAAATVAVAAESASGKFEEIIVTAQRRDESLSRTPVAVSALSSDILRQMQVVSEEDLRAAVPGLSIRAGLGSNQLNYALRGQSRDPYSGTRPGVLPYINEVQIGGAGGATAFYDLQSVQVLKGPQGTLFGRSATGGAVLFTTAKPTEETEGYLSVQGGNYDARKVEGAISGPIAGSNLRGRVAGFYQERDGFQDNLFDGGREGDMERYGVRASLTALFGERGSNELVFDYFEADGENTVGVLSGLLPFTGGGPGNPPFIPIEFLYAGIATPIARATGIGTLQAFVPPQFAPAAAPYYDAYFASPQHPDTGIRGVLADQQARGPYDVDSDAYNVYKAKNYIVTDIAAFDISDNLRIKNVFGYVDLDYISANEADGTPFSISGNGPKGTRTPQDANTKQVSEELQLLGTGMNQRLTYVVGLYYSDEKYTYTQRGEFFDLIFGGQSQINAFELKNETMAAYAQGTLQLGDSGWAATLGVRYTSEEVSKLQAPTDTIRIALGEPAPPGFDYQQTRDFNKVSWQAGLQNQLNDNVLLYAVSRRAYKSGGYNGFLAPRVGSAAIGGDAYEAERVTDVELGVKFEGDLGGVPARVNVAGYRNWISDSQRTGFSLVLNNPAALTVNVPKGKIYGVELDGQLMPADWLTLGGSLSYTDASFASDTVFVNGSGQQFDQVPDTPEFSGTLYADMRFPISGGYALTVRGDVYRQTKTYTTPRSQNSLGTTLPAYTLANFRVGLENPDAHWSASAMLKNAFDKTYYTGGLQTGEIYQINVVVPGEPRTFTLELRYDL